MLLDLQPLQSEEQKEKALHKNTANINRKQLAGEYFNGSRRTKNKNYKMLVSVSALSLYDFLFFQCLSI